MHSCVNCFTDLTNVPRCALVFPCLSHISVVPAMPLLNAKLGQRFVRSLLGTGTKDTSLPSYLASLLHLFSIACIIIPQIYYRGIKTVPLHTYVNSKLPHR